MFVQVIQGRTSDADGLRAALDRWEADLAPTAAGWLGSTAGVTDDGRAIAVVRFESEAAARANSERPEQGRWWAETERRYDGGVTFRESTDVVLDLQGDPDRAGFVQVMQGRTSDPQRARQLMVQDPDVWAAFRPDVLGSVVALHDGGAYTMVLYFTSEADARAGEGKEVPLELQPAMEEMDKLSLEDPEFFDLRQPELRSAARGS
jgi:hypothetical protein